MSHHIVQADNLYYIYPDGTVGIDGISFQIIHGESVALETVGAAHLIHRPINYQVVKNVLLPLPPSLSRRLISS